MCRETVGRKELEAGHGLDVQKQKLPGQKLILTHRNKREESKGLYREIVEPHVQRVECKKHQSFSTCICRAVIKQESKAPTN